jgi:hypothetical protein
MKMKWGAMGWYSRLEILGPSSERAIRVAALARNLHFFFPGIATGFTAVFLIRRNYTATRFMCAAFFFMFGHNLLLHPIFGKLTFRS